MTDKSVEERTIESIVKQFRGGEHRLAGARASELVYATGKPNQRFLQKLTSAAPGIDRYISAPERPIPMTEDQGGNPLATQPENRTDTVAATNLSTDQARQEQDQIDAKLKKGRTKRVKKDVEQETGGEDATKLNPDGSDQEQPNK